MSVLEAESTELALEQPSGLWRDAWARLRRNRPAIVGAVIVGLFVLIAVFAPLVAPHDPQARVGALSSVPPGPSSAFWFGLDEQGRDLFSRVVYGARLSLLVSIVAVSLGLSIGMLLGAIAGYKGGRIDGVIMRCMDVMLAFPGFLLAIGLVAVMGPGLFQVMFAIGIISVPQFSRLLRGSIIQQRQSDYVLAARSLGTPGPRTLLVHILPNALAPVIVQATLALATAIIEVAGLSFVGFGPQDPTLPEWGKMLADNAARLQRSSHLVLFPGFAIVLSVLGLNLIGDGLREALDPKLRR
ncbi:MAG TPA: ABC transporter permease [Euzebya sp.]|nr:ABC transporter permease [Euzebya sp.]